MYQPLLSAAIVVVVVAAVAVAMRVQKQVRAYGDVYVCTDYTCTQHVMMLVYVHDHPSKTVWPAAQRPSWMLCYACGLHIHSLEVYI